MRPAWQRRAAGRGKGTDWWFPTTSEADEAARAVCEPCPVRRECFAFAMADRELVGHLGWDGCDRTAPAETSERVISCGYNATTTPSVFPTRMKNGGNIPAGHGMYRRISETTEMDKVTLVMRRSWVRIPSRAQNKILVNGLEPRRIPLD